MSRKAYCIFADDIRAELGNKVSLMGIYQRSVNLETLPSTLPKFCVSVYVESPFKDKFKAVSVRIRLDETLISEQILPQEFLDAFWEDLEDGIRRGEID